MAPSVEHLGLGSGRDLRVLALSPALGSVLSVESARDSSPPPPSLPAPVLAHSERNNKNIFKKEYFLNLAL